MEADVSRHTFDPARNYSRVVLQQGRPLIDADFNEQTEILLHAMRQLTRDLLGDCCAIHGTAFELTKLTDPEGINFEIGPGRLYVDGIRCDCTLFTGPGERKARRYTYRDQFALAEPRFVFNDGWYLVYLEVWERTKTGRTDPRLLDPALGGADTSARTHVWWRVRVWKGSPRTNEPVDAQLSQWFEEFRDKAINEPRTGPKRGQMQVRLDRPEDPGATYVGPENQLYRFEVHRHENAQPPSLIVKWSRDNGTTVFPIKDLTKLQEGRIQFSDWDATNRLRPEVDDYMELVTKLDERRGEPGILGKLAAIDTNTGDAQLRIPQELPMQQGLIGADANFSQAGFPDVDYREVTGAFMRRWDGVLILNPDSSWQDIEDNVQVLFNPAQNYAPGSFWLVPVRVNGGLLGLPSSRWLNCNGPKRYFAPIGAVRVMGKQVVETRKYRHELRPESFLLQKGPWWRDNPTLPE